MSVLRYLKTGHVTGAGADRLEMWSPGRPGSGLLVLSWIVALALLAGAFARYAFEVAPNHDNVWLLISAERLIDGGRYYTDFFELNPPLYIVLVSPALFIADVLGIDSYNGFIVWVLSLIGGSILIAYRWLAILAESAPRLIPLLVVVYVGTLGWVADSSFGQREHISIILIFPYVVWLFRAAHAAPILAGPGLITTIALAATGFLIKPHFLVVPAVLAAAWFIMYRRWDLFLKIHCLVFGLIGSIYAVAIVTIFPEWFDVAAIALQVYGAYNPGMDRVLLAGGLYFLAMATIWIFTEILLGDEKARAVGRVSIVVATAFLVAAILQRKGYPYHYLPIQSLSFLAFGTVIILAIPNARGLINRISALPRYGLKQLTAALVATSLILAMALQVKIALLLPSPRSEIETSSIYVNLAELAKDRSVMIMSISLSNLPVASLLDLEWESRLPGHWIIPGILKLERENGEDAAHLKDLKQLAKKIVVEDLERYSPSLVAVYSGPHRTVPEGFDLLSFYQTDPAFAALWSSYRWVRKDGYWSFYTRDPGTNKEHG